MNTAALVTMVVGMVLIWGGLALSVTHAVRHRSPIDTDRPDN